MPFDGSGNFNRVMNWVNDALANIKILATRHDSEDDNFAAGLSNVICKDGQTSITANIPFNGKRATNLANPVNPQDAMTLAQMIASNVRYDVAQALTVPQQLQAHQNLAATLSVLPKGANYTLLPADRAKLLFITGTMNLTLPAASAVGNDFAFPFRVQGGVMTLVPNGTDQIEGINASLPIPSGAQGVVWSDGTQWFLKVNERVPQQGKAANYTAVMGDNGGRLVFSAAATLALAAAATLKSGWSLTVVGPAAGVITVDPNGAETIDGAATITIGPSQSATIFCDGANFTTNRGPGAVAGWETIGTGPSAAPHVFTDLGAYRTIRLSGQIAATADGILSLQVSTNNGSTWLSAGTDYTNLIVYGNSSNILGGATSNATFQQLSFASALANNFVSFDVIYHNFNVAMQSKGLLRTYTIPPAAAAHLLAQMGIALNGSAVRNALRVQAAAGAWTSGSFFILEGIRG